MKHTEYIIPIGEDALDYDEMFIGVIRRQPELVRCKDCKHWKSGFADVGGCDMFKSAGIRCSTMAEFFCAMAKPKETEG